MKLIVNADDFGLTEAVNLGIVECFRAGIVKSTTIMMNQPGTEHAIELYHRGQVPEVGLHFTVTSGKPVLPAEYVSSLVDDSGYFLDKSVLRNKADVNPAEVSAELYAQYQAAIDAGLKINHLDSHHFGGVFAPLKQAFTQVANEIGLPVRRIDNIIAGQEGLEVATPTRFDMRFFAEGVSLARFQELLLEHKTSCPDGIIEFMCHPSNAVTKELTQLSGYSAERVEELTILTDPKLKAWLDEKQIQCVGFDDLNN